MSNTYIGVDGVARKVNGIYVGVDGVARKVVNGWVGVNGVARLFYQSKVSLAIGSLPLGTEIYLTEADGDVPYIIIANNHYGLGEITLLRKHVLAKTAQFFSSAPSSAYNNRYSTSKLKSYCDNLYTALPAETQAKIMTIPLPCRECAQSGHDGITLDSTLYPLSYEELTSEGSSYDGVWMESFFPDNASRKAYKEDGTTLAQYWTRSPTSGMSTYSEIVGTSGECANAYSTNSKYVRPACNVLASLEVYVDDNGNYHI